MAVVPFETRVGLRKWTCDFFNEIAELTNLVAGCARCNNSRIEINLFCNATANWDFLQISGYMDRSKCDGNRICV